MILPQSQSQSLPPPPPPPYNHDSSVTTTSSRANRGDDGGHPAQDHHEDVSLLPKSSPTTTSSSTISATATATATATAANHSTSTSTYNFVWSKWQQRLAVLIFVGCAATFLWDGVELSHAPFDASNTTAKHNNETKDTTAAVSSSLIRKSESPISSSAHASLAANKKQNDDEPPSIKIVDNTEAEAEAEAVVSDGHDLDPVVLAQPGSSDTVMDKDTESTADPPETIPTTNPPNTMDHPKETNGCRETCTATTTQWNDVERFQGNDLTHAKSLQQVWHDQRQGWTTRLEQDYGTAVFQAVFVPNNGASVGREGIFTDPARLQDKKGRHPVGNYQGVAWNRMVRKHQLKILQLQLAILQERRDTCAQTCDTTTVPKRTSPTTTIQYYANWTWVTAGHSASAGHGNFYREAYTGVMERDLQPLFAAVGVNWQAKNYAMGGTTSAEEMALCFHSIYGKDADFVSWDFGMTDGN